MGFLRLIGTSLSSPLLHTERARARLLWLGVAPSLAISNCWTRIPFAVIVPGTSVKRQGYETTVGSLGGYDAASAGLTGTLISPPGEAYYSEPLDKLCQTPERGDPHSFTGVVRLYMDILAVVANKSPILTDETKLRRALAVISNGVYSLRLSLSKTKENSSRRRKTLILISCAVARHPVAAP
ncbi:hypothetical protein RRG08_015424 [Elysia crispata]|uniref:Uncharacterized protein n=1 Tax=Elysia crispata TaxID=231223 RepID=A0AAE1CYQ4_9GAST|nr:hypothetical protein RRG08_015424 [Elysia crispata]